jgi:hypothetical protein
MKTYDCVKCGWIRPQACMTCAMITTQADVRASMDATADRYPQYVGYGQGWGWSVALRDASTKGGTVMLKGDAVLVDWASESIGGRYGRPRPFVSIWSARRDGAVSIDKRFIASER